jgi:uncharacterized protein YjbJ (UPF0337 family)
MLKFGKYRQDVGSRDVGRGVRRFFAYAICLIMVGVAAWGGMVMPSAIAAGVGSQSAADVVNSRAAAELDRVSGAGTSDKLEGAAQETAGKVKRGINGVNGSADQVEGKVKRDVGRAKGAAADAGEDIKEGANGMVESIKDFFNK